MNARKRPFKSGLHLASRSFLAGIAIYVNGIESMEGQRLCEVESFKKKEISFQASCSFVLVLVSNWRFISLLVTFSVDVFNHHFVGLVGF